jgi:3'-phosphoadenosine 5'-phosphosulfate sulfotransferase
MDERERRIGLNEALFREVNEAVQEVSERFDAPGFEIVCECGSLGCDRRVSMTNSEYEELRSESHHFAVIAGHEKSDVEEVVAQRRGYFVVRKTGAAARALAERTDPREK